MRIIVFISILFLFSGCNSNPDISTPAIADRHKDSITNFINEYVRDIWNKGDFTKAEKYWGADFKNIFAPQFPHGPEGMKKQAAYFFKAFTDFHFDIKDILIEGDKISLWAEIRGTHTGELFGIPATNKKVIFREAVWYKMKDGKLDEVYPFVDYNSLFEQLGQYPSLQKQSN